MLRVALERPDLVSAIVGLSPDADFTEELLMAQLSDEDKKTIMEKGLATIKWGNTDYVVSRNLIEVSRCFGPSTTTHQPLSTTIHHRPPPSTTVHHRPPPLSPH